MSSKYRPWSSQPHFSRGRGSYRPDGYLSLVDRTLRFRSHGGIQSAGRSSSTSFPASSSMSSRPMLLSILSASQRVKPSPSTSAALLWALGGVVATCLLQARTEGAHSVTAGLRSHPLLTGAMAVVFLAHVYQRPAQFVRYDPFNAIPKAVLRGRYVW